jgi:thiol-disulfide isomerase/thioredoxin
MRTFLSVSVLALAAGLACPAGAEEPQAIEKRIVSHIKENLKPGQPVIISKLYNEVFTSAEERQVLDKLNRAFFRIPLFLVEHQASLGRLPTLEEIAGQFAFYGVEEAAVVLGVMEADPRVPKFVQRDATTGEVVAIDVEKIKADPRFNQMIERSLTGWQGKWAPEVTATGYDGSAFSLSALKGKTVLFYVWFTNCPPCMRIGPELVAIHNKYRERGFTVVGANSDRVLGLSYDDAVRTEYAKKLEIGFPLIHLSPEGRAALGNVNIFPTLFLMNPQGVITHHYVNYQPRETLERDIEQVLAAGGGSSEN